MSKAFTREEDSDRPSDPVRRRGLPIPDPNYVTPEGARAARAELEQLARDGGDPDRIRELEAHLATALPTPPGDLDTVGLGATVTVQDEDGKQTVYRIVGAIESDPRNGALSWQTPVASALWGARVGDAVQLPRGSEVEIVAIAYPAS